MTGGRIIFQPTLAPICLYDVTGLWRKVGVRGDIEKRHGISLQALMIIPSPLLSLHADF